MTDTLHAPDVDYLTRDYEGFRQLLLSLVDRSGTPWTERSAADTGVMLVEVLAQQLDLMAYAGDRVAEEAFLGTARRRESARRHARLGDHDLDRGNATRGEQHFRLRPGQPPLLLRAGAQVGPRLRRQDPEPRLVAETTEDALLDPRRNEFSLARSAAQGAQVLHLAAADGSRLDLATVGLQPGMRLCIVDRDGGEVLTLRSVQGGAVELASPLSRTWLAGSADAPRVLGNLVLIRAGATVPWQLVGHGGASMNGDAPGESVVPAARFLALRLDVLRRLREVVEAAREAWIGDASLAEQWRVAGAAASRVARSLRDRVGASPPPGEAAALDEQLQGASRRYRDILVATGRAVPPELRPTSRAPLPGQRIPLDGEQPTLWLDGAVTLEVLVGGAGRWRGWTEVEDFLRSGPGDRHFVVETDDRGQVALRFGGGENGAVLPADGQVLVQRVAGDDDLGDLGVRALDTLIGSGDPDAPLDLDAFDPETPTFNPLATRGGRSPEDLDELVRRVRRGLQQRVVPVTAPDHEALLEERADVAEAKASASRGRVEVVLRPRPEAGAGQVLEQVRALLRERRLAGTDVWVRLAEPLYASVALLVDVHPEVSPSDLRLRLRRRLLELFGEEGEALLGRTRTRAEVYAAVEGVPGVIYSEVVGFDVASHPDRPLAAQEAIVPAAHQVVRCLDLQDDPLAGTIRVWTARRFHLLAELAYADPDDRPDVEHLRALIERRLSGPGSVPAREQWSEITPGRVDGVLRQTPPPGARYRLSLRRLMVGERAVERVPLGPGELPVLDFVRIRERPFLPHYGLVLALTGAGDQPPVEEIRARVEEKLSGIGSIPVVEGWKELTAARIDPVIAGLAPGHGLSVRTLTVAADPVEGAPSLPPGVDPLGSRRAVARVALEPGDVPVLDDVQIAFDPRGPW